MRDEGAGRVLCQACFSPTEGEEENPKPVSQRGLLCLELLLDRMRLLVVVLPKLHTKLAEGAGMKGCSVLEIKMTNSKAFVLRLVLVAF